MPKHPDTNVVTQMKEGKMRVVPRVWTLLGQTGQTNVGQYHAWYIYRMVAQNTVRTYGVNQAFRFVEGTWLHRQSRQIRFRKIRKRPIFPNMCATCCELPSYMCTLANTNITLIASSCKLLPPIINIAEGEGRWTYEDGLLRTDL